jgi:hydroxypyruvate isomerase
MPSFAANLSFLWQELSVYERFAAAAEAGFSRVEILFVHDLDLDRVQALLREHRLELVIFDPYPGDWSAGERGLLSLAGREQEFLRTLREAIRSAQKLGTPRLNTLAGIPTGPREEAHRTAVSNLRAGAPLAEAAGITLLVEGINSIDMPGYFADTVDLAAALVREVAHPSVRLQLDQYHVGMIGGDARASLREYATLVEHVQIADVPGRHQPGTGSQPITAFLQDLDDVGYRGSVGLEYRPLGSTAEALDWLPRGLRGGTATSPSR